MNLGHLASVEWILITILLLLLVASGGFGVSRSRIPQVGRQLERIEAKLDLMLANLGVQYVPPAQLPWQKIADDPGRKIEAIKAHRDEYGSSLAGAKRAVEDYLRGRDL